MSSEASSEQSCVCEGVGYDEVYPSGQNDPDTSQSKRVPSTNSPSEEEDEDLEVDRKESGIDGNSDSEENVESPIRSIMALMALGIFFFPHVDSQ